MLFKTLGIAIKYLIIIIVTMALLLLIASNFDLKINKIGSYRLLNVLTGSMEPNIPKGSFIVIKSADKEGIKSGDIITYKGKNSNALITHRVVEINKDNDYITKGDANEGRDLHAVEYNRVLGIVIYHIPKLGQWILFLRENLLLVILIFIFFYFSHILFLKLRS